jgi:hypothetical protein
VRPEPVVKINPPADARASFRTGFVSVQADVFILERAPKAFNKRLNSKERSIPLLIAPVVMRLLNPLDFNVKAGQYIAL